MAEDMVSQKPPEAQRKADKMPSTRSTKTVCRVPSCANAIPRENAYGGDLEAAKEFAATATKAIWRKKNKKKLAEKLLHHQPSTAAASPRLPPTQATKFQTAADFLVQRGGST